MRRSVPLDLSSLRYIAPPFTCACVQSQSGWVHSLVLASQRNALASPSATRRVRWLVLFGRYRGAVSVAADPPDRLTGSRASIAVWIEAISALSAVAIETAAGAGLTRTGEPKPLDLPWFAAIPAVGERIATRAPVAGDCRRWTTAALCTANAAFAAVPFAKKALSDLPTM
jgi:hypothetical protein